MISLRPAHGFRKRCRLDGDDRGTGLQKTAREPGLVWCYRCDEKGVSVLDAALPPPDVPFRWIHLNLSDQRSLRWLEERQEFGPSIHALMLTRDSHQRCVVEGGVVGLLLHDFERGFDPSSVGRIGSLHVALSDGLLVTGRYRPLHSADLFRARLEEGEAAEDAETALGVLLATLTDSMGSLVLDLTTELLDAEENLLVDDLAPDTRRLIAARRRAAQLHRMIGGMRATLQRLERQPGLPPELAPVAQRFQPRLSALDTDIVAAQNQLKLLRDELDLQAAQRINSNIYLLSILTALMMPATLVTGFFGMNTSGLPFAQGQHGTLMATIVALVSAGGSYWLLKLMGLVRRQ